MVTEFLPPVSWSGRHNTINCAAGHHFYEGRWIRDPRYLDDYARFWFGRGGDPGGTSKHYSNWIPDGILARYLVNGDGALATSLLDGLARDFEAWGRDGTPGDPWGRSRRLDDGLYWQIDSWEGQELSIGGMGARPSMNGAMYGNAMAIARIAAMAGRIRRAVQDKLWDPADRFFKMLRRREAPTDQYDNASAERREAGRLVTARELFGYAPWYFRLPEDGRGYEEAWRALYDPAGFLAPYGPSVAERRHPRGHG